MHALRNYDDRMKQVTDSIRRITSGKKHNAAADAPADVYMGDILKNKVSGLRQTFDNNEQSATLLQIAEGGLAEVVGLLTELKQLAVHAANEAVNDQEMLDADQLEIEQKLQALDSIASNTRFGNIKLLDGSMGSKGVTVGDHLSFVNATQYTPATPEKGLLIDINQVATRARFEGMLPLDLENIGDGIHVLVKEFENLDPVIGPTEIEGNQGTHGTTRGKYASIDTRSGELKKEIAQIQKNHRRDPVRYSYEKMSREVRNLIMYELNKGFAESGMDIEIFERPDSVFVLRHKEFGDGHSFSVVCNIPNVLTPRPMVAENAMEGLNVEGTIAGYAAVGKGQYLTAREGSPTQGLRIRYDRELDYVERPVFDEKGQRIGSRYELEPQSQAVDSPVEGYVHISQGSKQFYLDSNQGDSEPFSLLSVRSGNLGQNVVNQSDFESLADIDVTNVQGARDALRLIDKSIDDILEIRTDVGSFQKNTIEKTLSNVAAAADNLAEGTSVLSDTDVAQAMSRLTRNEIMMLSGQSVLAHANQKPSSVLSLVRS